MNAPTWALTAAYWLHMLATVVLIGGLAGLVLLALPAVRQSMGGLDQSRLLTGLLNRVDTYSWLSLLVLAGTGMFQMSAHPSYGGFFSFENQWSAAILAKHTIYFGMLIVSAYVSWGLLPKMRRQAFLQTHGRGLDIQSSRLARSHLAWLRINLILAVIILGLTALARVS
jgi:uncharacterized membrane protein